MRTRRMRICCCMCIAAMVLALIAQAMALDKNTDKTQPKILRIGFENKITRPVNDLDMLSPMPDNSPRAVSISGQKPIHDVSMLSRTTPKAAFNISQRVGMVARFTYDTGIFKPFYNVSAYGSVKPIYGVPGSVHNKPVYNIDNYPRIKAVNSIP